MTSDRDKKNANDDQVESEKAVLPEETPAETVDVRGATLSVIVVLGTILMLQYAQSVLIPVVVAVLISYVLEPAVTSMEKRHIPRILGSVIAIVLLCGAIGVAVYTLTDEAMAIVESVPPAARRLAHRLESRRGEPDDAFGKMQTAAKEIEQAAAQAAEPSAAPKGVQRVQVVEPTFAAQDYLWAGGANLLTLAGQSTMVLFLVFFLLVTGDLFKRKLVKIAGPTLTKKKITVQIMDEINRQISSFLRVQVLTSLLVGFATAVVLWWFGVANYVVWGLLSGLFNSIPYLGPVMVTSALSVVTFMQFDDLTKSAYVAAATLAITSVEGWLLTPALMGRAARMNPVAIFVGLLFWSWIWGIWGTILAVPMMMMLKATCDHIEAFQGVGELLGE
jgi:predicted PurR-regulated permease PerM